MAKYEIWERKPSKIIATADDIPSLINAALKVARDEGWEVGYGVPNQKCFAYYEDEIKELEWVTSARLLTLTPPPPKSPVQEWREREPDPPVKPDSYYSDWMLYMEKFEEYVEQHRQWLSEMPEGE